MTLTFMILAAVISLVWATVDRVIKGTILGGDV